MTNSNKKFSRRMIAFFWLLAVAVLIGVLVAMQQVAILYVLATISLVVLLLIVAFSDLERVGQENL